MQLQLSVGHKIYINRAPEYLKDQFCSFGGAHAGHSKASVQYQHMLLFCSMWCKKLEYATIAY